MRLLWERAKLLVEPSASVALAAVLDDRFRQIKRFNRIGVILSGGNVDLNHLPCECLGAERLHVSSGPRYSATLPELEGQGNFKQGKFCL